jgi:FHA domain
MRPLARDGRCTASRGTATGQLGAFACWAEDTDPSPLALARRVFAGLTASADGTPLLLFVDDAHLLDDLSALIVLAVVVSPTTSVGLIVDPCPRLASATARPKGLSTVDQDGPGTEGILMPTCVEGHESAATDYCDVCGAPIGAPAAPSTPSDPESEACPACGMPVSGRFCEACGHASALPAPAAPPTVVSAAGPAVAEPPAAWLVVVAADREFYERVLARDGPDTVDFPQHHPSRRIALRGNEILIGRAKPEQGVEPGIDLGLHPADRGVSSQHAVLRVGDAGLTITDIGSTNGTSHNGSEELLANGTEVPLADGDRIHVGAFTTITVVRQG